MPEPDEITFTERHLIKILLGVAIASILLGAGLFCLFSKPPREPVPHAPLDAEKVGEAVGKTGAGFGRGVVKGSAGTTTRHGEGLAMEIQFRIVEDLRPRYWPWVPLPGDEAQLRTGEAGHVVTTRQQDGKVFILLAPTKTYLDFCGDDHD